MLSEVRPRVAYPPTPDLAQTVRIALTRPPAPSRRAARWPFQLSPHRAAALAALALAVLLLGMFVLFPSAPVAIADRLGLRGVTIRFLDEAPTPAPSPVGGRLALGRRIDLDDARAQVAFPIHVPTLDGFDSPDEVYLSLGPSDGMVSFVYRAASGLPPTPETGVGALLTQFRAETDRDLIEKSLLGKGLSPTATLELVSVNGGRGFWIEGPGHFFLYRDSAGSVELEEYRLAGNALLWEQDGLTFRLESALPKERAVALAESVRAEG